MNALLRYYIDALVKSQSGGQPFYFHESNQTKRRRLCKLCWDN